LPRNLSLKPAVGPYVVEGRTRSTFRDRGVAFAPDRFCLGCAAAHRWKNSITRSLRRSSHRCRTGTYLFDRADREDWIAQHFFTGGVMPSHHLIRQYADLFEIEKEWRWSGTHYQRTALDWLANFDTHADEIEAALRKVYGSDTGVDAALALVLPRDRRPVRLRRRR
jgi:hypothetical protein